jgi:sigma-B regulation protein RsbU (phosphoserine phosphatase)
MDSIFFLGRDNDQLPSFLQRLGYSIIEPNNDISLPEFVSKSSMDLILIDGRSMGDVEGLCAFFRGQQNTRAVPIVCISEKAIETESPDDSPHAVEVVQTPFSVGALASRIALTLRLRKLAGTDERKSSLAEINANLRDHNSKFKKELEEARAIQESLLPRVLPRDPRLELAVSYEPLDEVGGDWYFASKTSSGLIALQIADVSGHGLSAAFIGSMAKLAMTAAATEEPSRLLEEMNRLLAPQIPSGRFVTMGSCLYDPATGKVQWARAGHPPALLLRRQSHEVVKLLGEGFAVGFFEDSSYSLLEDKLEVGDALLMFTDGITEAQNLSGDAFGLDRLSAALASTAQGHSCADMLKVILDAFDEFRGERLIRDDVTVLLLKRTL